MRNLILKIQIYQIILCCRLHEVQSLSDINFSLETCTLKKRSLNISTATTVPKVYQTCQALTWNTTELYYIREVSSSSWQDKEKSEEDQKKKRPILVIGTTTKMSSKEELDNFIDDIHVTSKAVRSLSDLINFFSFFFNPFFRLSFRLWLEICQFTEEQHWKEIWVRSPNSNSHANF